MKRLYSILTVIVALVVFAPLAVANPPFWDDQVNTPARFKKLSEFGNAAVFDKETGLVWEQSLDTDAQTWISALSRCYQRSVGGRKGWRLPTIEELASLLQPGNPSEGPDLPLGHPFVNVQSSFYWSATADASSTGKAWFVNFDNGFVNIEEKTTDFFLWCVRGGQGIDGAGQGTAGTL